MFTFSENTSSKNGTWDGSGCKSRRLGSEGLKFRRKRNACRSKGVLVNSGVDERSSGDASSSELAESSSAKLRVSISRPWSCGDGQ